MNSKSIQINDPYLQPYLPYLEARCQYAQRKEKELTQGKPLSSWANGYLYFGLHLITEPKKEWIIREWAPNATAIYLICDQNQWRKSSQFQFSAKENGVWELKLPFTALQHRWIYKLLVEWEGGCGERIPSYAQRVVQDEETKIFSAQVWNPSVEDTYCPKYNVKMKRGEPLFIYECHIGMSGSEERVSSFEEFRRNVLPRVAALGYNCLQIMAIQEHPYYGSFGYHVTNFFAASSRFGTPDDLKHLIDDAHSRNIAVIMDLVHSHAAKNESEGLGRFDGSTYQYFHEGSRREHPAWDSLCFNYGKNEVLHFLLSNCKFWLDVYNFDGFRFDGVTSMMFMNHGLGQDFGSYDNYFDGNEDGDAIMYLTLANKLIHQVKKQAITIAEDMSGMPMLATSIEKGGMGFDFRLSMGIPDFWIKYIKEVKDEFWRGGHILYEMTNRRNDEKTISYAESHDQALVGDKTIIFRLIDADMYWHFEHGHSTLMVDRGVALHKMIRLITASTINGGYLNFMGNEFGHPEWIDFPREGNGWSYKYARRQWELVDNPNYFFADLNRFDHDMIQLLKTKLQPTTDENGTHLPWIYTVWDKSDDQIIAFRRNNLLFVFNWNGTQSFDNYGMLVQKGKYKVVLNTDNIRYGGFGLTDDSIEHLTQYDALYETTGLEWIKLYLPARSAVVLEKVD